MKTLRGIKNLFQCLWKGNWRLAKRELLFFKQRWTRGFDDSELWDLDISLARLILPRLKAFKEYQNNRFINSKVYNKDLDKMINAFESILSDFDLAKNLTYNQEDIQEGLDLFANQYRTLWD